LNIKNYSIYYHAIGIDNCAIGGKTKDMKMSGRNIIIAIMKKIFGYIMEIAIRRYRKKSLIINWSYKERTLFFFRFFASCISLVDKKEREKK
jgi:hypothetical protein